MSSIATYQAVGKRQSRITGAVYIMGAQALVLVLGYVTHLWIGRELGPSLYGVYGVVLSMQSIFGLFLTLGVPVAVSRFVARDEETAQSVLAKGVRLQMLIAVIVAGSVLLLSPVLARLLGDPTLTSYIAFSAAVIFAQALYPVYTQFFGGIHLFSRQSLLTAIYAVVKLAGALSLIYVLHVYGAFAGFLIGGIAAAIFGWYWTRGVGGSKPTALSTRSFLAFAGIYVLVLVGLQILISLDLFMVKAFLRDDTVAGYYNAAVTLSRIPYQLLQALGFIVLPSVAMLTRPGRSHDEAAQFISDTIRYLIALIVPSVALAAATSKPLILLFYSTPYLPAAPVLTILMVGLGSIAFYLLLANIVAAAGRPTFCVALTAGLLAVSGILGYVLIPRWGLMGAAWQTTIAGIIGLAVMAVYTFRSFHIPIPIRSTLNILIASAIAVLPTYFWQATPVTLFLQYIVAGLLYVLALVLLREVNSRDVERLGAVHPIFKRWQRPA